MQESKTITILLNRFDGFFNRLICVLSESNYSHAAIALDDAHNEFYSFSYTGFTVERPFFRKKRSEMLEIRLSVPTEQYEQIREAVERFLSRKNELKYAKLGFALLLLRIPARFKNRYFCSQFIAELLSKSGVANLRKDASLYYPAHLIDRVEYISSPVLTRYAAI